MDIGQVGCFPTQRRPVVDDLELNLFAGVIDDWHESKRFFRRAEGREFAHHGLDLFPNSRFKRSVVMENR